MREADARVCCQGSQKRGCAQTVCSTGDARVCRRARVRRQTRGCAREDACAGRAGPGDSRFLDALGSPAGVDRGVPQGPLGGAAGRREPGSPLGRLPGRASLHERRPSPAVGASSKSVRAPALANSDCASASQKRAAPAPPGRDALTLCSAESEVPARGSSPANRRYAGRWSWGMTTACSSRGPSAHFRASLSLRFRAATDPCRPCSLVWDAGSGFSRDRADAQTPRHTSQLRRLAWRCAQLPRPALR